MRVALSLSLAACLAAFAPRPAHAAAANDCADPYWSRTLRCRALAFLAQGPGPLPPPQPTPPPPAGPAAIGPYTRVDLDANPAVRCVDGTRPIIYVDPAVDGPSNRWLIVTTGGESCAARDADGDGSFENGNACALAYAQQNGQLMGTANEPSTSALVDPDGSGNGILKPDLARNPVFARYNRVRVHKCGFDRHSGRATHPGVTATFPNGGPTFTYDLYNHGQKIVLEALAALDGGGAGLTYRSYVASGGAVVPVMRTLPSIADAEQVVLVGHSAAAHGLYQNADRYADFLRTLPGFDGDVRAIHDAQFQPSAENEAAFDPAQNPDPAGIVTLFDQRTTGTTAAIGAYDAFRHYGPGTRFTEDYRAWLETPLSSWATLLDASCVAAHEPAGDAWKCFDRLHVLLHHESTSTLLREDITDPNLDHNNVPFGHIMAFGEPGTYPHCDGLGDDLFGAAPCPPTLTPAQNRNRLLVQAMHLRAGFRMASELATNADPSPDPGPLFVWMPDCLRHDGIYDDNQFFGTRIVQDGEVTSYRGFAEAFVATPADGADRFLVHGLDGAASECAPPLLADSFE